MKRDQQLVSHFLSALSQQCGASFKVLRWPDVDNRQTPAVEAIASDASGEIVAIEHMLVQPFRHRALYESVWGTRRQRRPNEAGL
jgi:hypothetical protein